MSEKLYSLRDAAKRANVSIVAMHNWCKKYDIADKKSEEFNGWIIDVEKLDTMVRARLTIENMRRTKS